MAYFSLPANPEGNCDFTADEFTVHADLIAAEMQEHNTNKNFHYMLTSFQDTEKRKSISSMKFLPWADLNTQSKL